MARSGISGAGITCVVLALCLAVPTLATVYTVGDTSGWASGVDYTTWSSTKTFAVGDSLLFNYGGSHSVDEVSSSDYSSCSTSNTLSSDSSGATTVALKTAGAHYFICGTPGHCSNGMKLSVTVAASTPSGTPPASGTPPPTTTNGTSSNSPPPPASTTPSSSVAVSPVQALVMGVAGFIVMVVS